MTNNNDFSPFSINLLMQNKIHILVRPPVSMGDHASFNIFLKKLYKNNVFDSYLVKADWDSDFTNYDDWEGFTIGYAHEYQLKISNSHYDLDIAKDLIEHLRDLGAKCTFNVLN